MGKDIKNKLWRILESDEFVDEFVDEVVDDEEEVDVVEEPSDNKEDKLAELS
jgi:predicted RNA-binding protein YlqC (UPF0109 family)